ncbi:uncharacterized mitochondrial protein AtMg00860-like [Malania oleifera]|uniref:uncharacterized mitochondrial protein AtMg00860-like n=1 Tax=Malania oleifera TaxID=397392 RepID=UPI0025AEA8CE|nr:uncharacterized mitochondrial protein AtMg00860-like [Malania oleifera]
MALQILLDQQLFAKRSKCKFGCREVEYLGYLVSSKGVRVDPSKLQAMIDWTLPKTLKALRGFLGLTRYYRRFIKGYGAIATPLTSLLKKNRFHWNEEAKKAFRELKEAVSTPPILALPDFTKKFTIECDASGKGIGAVLMQQGQPIVYFSQALKGRALLMSTYEKDLVALVTTVK